ncbi:protein-disulfide reductase DsbD family protein [Dongia sp. agr-C8]
MTRKCASGATLLLALLWACIAHAESGAGNRVETEQSAARLVTAVTGAGDLKTLPAGLEITLKPGWKTYWRSPGDAGFAPELKFDGSENVTWAQLKYPTPHRFELFGFQTFGYKEQVVYPIAVTPERPGEAVKLRAHLRYLVCEQVCIPYDADLALDIPAGPALPSDQAPLINRFEAMVPGPAVGSGLQVGTVRIEAGNKLVIEARSDTQDFVSPDAIVEGMNGLLFGKPSVVLDATGRHAALTLPIETNAGSETSGTVTLTLTDGDRSVEERVYFPSLAPGTLLTSAVATPQPATPESSPLLLILGIALLGGLILNVMPCVLPVLVLKLTSVLQHGGGEGEHVRLSFLATAAGIISAFLALAASLVGLKLAGHEIGWGIQFQQPVFLAVLATICLVFAANLWGLFQVPLPALAGDLALAADQRARNHKVLGAFLTGVFATVLATPCSAPFVGTAIGFALSRGGTEIFAIFLAMAIGLSLPYLAVAAAPHLAVMLPRPGRWMVWLRKALGVSMAATALWLGWVLAGQVGLLQATPISQVQGEAVRWQAFEPDKIPELVAAGKTVFVDVTAEWCITCKANKALLIDPPPVSTMLNQDNVVAMVADWTRPDPVISRFLAQHNRYGIPLNVVYGPGAPQGIVVPEICTVETMVDAIRKAQGL